MWQTLDLEAMLRQKEEAVGAAGVTTTANVGAYQVPLGPVLRRPDITGSTTPTGFPVDLDPEILRMLGF